MHNPLVMDVETEDFVGKFNKVIIDIILHKS